MLIPVVVNRRLTLIKCYWQWLIKFCLCCSMSAACAAKWQVCLDENPWPPYNYPMTNDTKKLTGYTIELVTQILTHLELDYEFVRLPWSDVHHRAKNYLPNLTCDLVLDVSLTPEREMYLYFSQPLYQLKYSLVYDSRHIKPFKINNSSIKHHKFCGVTGYNYGILADLLTIQRLPTIQSVLDSLNSQCDFFIIEAAILQNAIKKQLYAFNNMECINLQGTTKNYRLGVAKKTPQSFAYVTAIDRHINLLRRQGVLNQLAESYSLEVKNCQGNMSLNSLR